MTELAQAVASAYLQEPNHARGRPSRFFKREFYKSIFTKRYPIELYVVCALLKKRVSEFLVTVEKARVDRTNLLFYVLMAVICIHFKIGERPKAKALGNLDVTKIPDSEFKAAWETVRPIYDKFAKKAGEGKIFGGDVAAKGPDMVEELRITLRKKFPPRPKRKRSRP
jgi:hypothetical protein